MKKSFNGSTPLGACCCKKDSHPILAMRWGIAIRKQTQPKRIIAREADRMSEKIPRWVSGSPVKVSRAVMIRGLTGFQVASHPANPELFAG